MVGRYLFNSIVVLISFTLFSACNSNVKQEKVKSAFDDKLISERLLKDKEMVSDGIIESKDIADFKGLNYYEPDSTFKVKAKLNRLPPIPITFKTNTERNPQYFTFGVLKFNIGDSICTLIVYTSKIDASDGLFIPFKDASNVKETYGGGRYIEMPYSGEKDFLTIDFNRAFNPYCHYNHSYSCPIVPIENYLNVNITAGEKKFHE